MAVATLERANERGKTSLQADNSRASWAKRFETVGRRSIQYSLILVLLWIGAMKFTAYEAESISGFVANSPLMSWAYQVISTRQFSGLLGVIELAVALLIAARPFSARLSAVGSALAAGMFLTTLSFLFSTPGVVESSLGFPALSVVPGQFLIKDFVLLGAAVWTTGEALGAARRNAASRGCAGH